MQCVWVSGAWLHQCRAPSNRNERLAEHASIPACAQEKREALKARLESNELTQILTGHCLGRPAFDRRNSARSDHSSSLGRAPSYDATPRSPGARAAAPWPEYTAGGSNRR